MDLYSRARKYIDIKRVKELREEKIKERKLAEIAQQQEIILAEIKRLEMLEDPKFSNWKRELEEGMNTSALGMINLNPEIGDLQSNSVGSSAAYSQSDSVSFGGSAATFDFSGSPHTGNTYSRSAYFKPTNATQFDTFVTNVTVGSGPSQWFEPRDHGGSPTHSFPGGFRVVMYSKSKESDLDSYVATELSSGTNTITIPSNLRVSDLVVYYIGHANEDPLNGGATGSHTVSSATFQRRTPMNIFVPLDDPEAVSFIRTDPSMQGLSAAQREKKLLEMLEAGDEYLMKQLGIVGSSARPQETVLQPSFMDIQAGGERITKRDGETVTDTTRGIEDGMMDGKPFNPKPPPPKPPQEKKPTSTRGPRRLTSAEIAAIARERGDKYYGTAGSDNPDSGSEPTNPLTEPPKPTDDRAEIEKNIKDSLKQLEIDSEQLKGENLQRNINMALDLGLDILTVVTLLSPIPGDEAAAISAQAAKAGIKTGAKTAAQKAAIKKAKKDAIWKSYGSPRPTGRPGISKGRGMGDRWEGPLSNSYELEGEVLSEKKKLKSPKDIASKIPGYYDGKPAPLGFPMDEPPKMVNGYHPDLVDGKKVANRYNRLDPTSAKAMPKTGNPHIDKKVKAAAKKPN